MPLLNDVVAETTESFRLTLSQPTGGVSLGTYASTVIQIFDNDRGLRFSQTRYAVGEDAGSVQVTVDRGSDAAFAFTVDYATEDVTAAAGQDYVATSGTLHFAAEDRQASFTVPLLNDTVVQQGKHSFRVVLKDPTGGATIANPTATIVIDDNDPGVQLTSSQYTVAENGGPAAITVRRGSDTEVPFTVDYRTEDGTALAGEDYEATTGTLSFAAGEREKTFTVPVVNDGWSENNEVFSVVLTNLTGGQTLGSPSRTQVLVQDNDAGLSFDPAWSYVPEDAGVVTLKVRRASDTVPVPISVDYTTRDGSALAGEDYTATTGGLEFAPGETEKTLTIPVLDDHQGEFLESFEVVLSNPSPGVALGATPTARITVMDRGGPEEVPLPGRLRATQERGYPRLEWPNLSGQAFQLETREDLKDAGWHPLAVITGDAETLTWVDETDRSRTRFYRVGTLMAEAPALRLQRILEQTRAKTGLKGVSAAAILPGAGIWTGTSGKSYAGTYAPPIRPQTRFSVASVTKNFCAALILQLCDEGKLTLDEPLSQCLPEWVDERRIAGRITIRQLLNHTSGVGDYVDPVTTAFINEWVSDLTAPSRKAELVTLMGEPMFAPGTSWGYCNANFILLGLIAERATGNTVLNEFHRRFFTPLQLGGMYLGGEELLEGECAAGHNWSTGDYLNVKLMPGEPSSVRILGLGHAWSAFALVATAENLARWSQALFGGTVLSEASLRAMTTDPQRTVWSGMLGNPEGYGLGCAIFDSRWGHLLGVSGGDTAGHLTRMLYSPEREYALTVIVNDGSLGDFTKIDTIVAALLDLLHASTGGLGLRSPGDE